MSFIGELKRRNVFRVGLAYVVASWLLMQVVDVLTPVFSLPDWAPKLMFLIMAVGILPVLLFSWAFEMTPEGLKRESEVSHANSITAHTAKKLDIVTIALLIAAIAVVALDRFLPETGVDSPAIVANETTPVVETETTIDPPQGSSAPEKSIAVLAFVNMSDDEANEYFSDGISEEILNALAKIKEIKVAGRTSSFAFKGRDQDIREIGNALNVSHILEGSVRKAGNRVRITAQLIKVEDGFHLWSENYDRELDDVFAIQDEISNSILGQLKAHLIGEPGTLVAQTDGRAYDHYLLARQRIYERNQSGLQMASDLLNEAISIDPGYAPAHAQLGIATFLLSEDDYGELPTSKAYPQAKAHFEQALSLDPSQPDALAGLGLYHFVGLLDYETGIALLKSALAINPNLTNARVWLGSSLSDTGDLDGAITILKESFERDPLHQPTFNNLSQGYAVTGEPEKGRKMLSDLRVYLPGDASVIASLGKVEAMAGHWAESNRLLEQAVEIEPQNWSDRSWLSYSLLGSRQYERMAEMGTENFKALALSRLDRMEESLLIGGQWVQRGNHPQWYFQSLTENGRFEQLLTFMDSRWQNLDALILDFPDRQGFGASMLGDVAHSYSQVGNEAMFHETMKHYQASLDAQSRAGANNWAMSESLAHFAMLSGDHDQAMALLDQAVQQGSPGLLAVTGKFSVYAPLRGEPRFEEILFRMNQRINEARVKLGLKVSST